jgi:hypothetical protein
LFKLLQDVNDLDGILARSLAAFDLAVEGSRPGNEPVPLKEQLRLTLGFEKSLTEVANSVEALLQTLSRHRGALRHLTVEEVTWLQQVFKRLLDDCETGLQDWERKRGRVLLAWGSREEKAALVGLWEAELGVRRIRSLLEKSWRTVLEGLRNRVVAAIATADQQSGRAGESGPGLRYTVTLDQAAAFVNRSKHSLRKYKDLPDQVNPGRKRGQPGEYYWDQMKSFLEKHFGRRFEDIPPSARPLDEPRH